MESPDWKVLQFFDRNNAEIMSVDNSKDDMGTMILQNRAYASKSLTECQQGYAQIEKEFLAITFRCQKFHQYLYGKRFVVEINRS